MNKVSLTHNKLVQSALVLFVIDLVFFGSLNTSKVAQFMLVVGFVLLIANLYVVVYGATSLIRLYGVPVKRKKRLSLYISLFLGLLIALQSVGELSSHDAVVILVLAIVSYGYITYASMTEQKEPNL